ncbi:MULTISPECIES: 3-hydroxyacyl-ACP dehydratase FabZ [Pandoraea]|uniref:3-hydroxyacyl-[acyl-carrier-protein] dehydratase FabZ n=4 Tax=Pandoraea TaxID=93217 RepID=A0A5E4YVB8_9BURK|nr:MULTISPECIES: 3-hydroxyacyl-ACP dehydratase FabZ [Pandoraea]AJC17294.1 3-hydroxyacyl-[acyl-carrier-protein] dehydratase FabZ [Pandoraea sputorum]AKC70593.1 3-hydroxyacyl-[acyl-carrier-protein] dehydratase FabZ [Pandoraea oxalativorans]MCE4059297.1 3-hydroxyacyl-ACP dehydratase FabZ [Pandoraea sputorum]UVA81697.1 3-hydroxyacyl-ACP dehydratase FabZ [Pandoraea commovens]SNU85571.1 (3R)-hydroxymyristoyl-[acyl-carrier-protein] dehydratase [Pandoraea sputorum]
MSETTITIDIHKIMKLLPHRYPMLMVDRVIGLEPHKNIKVIKNVTINEPYFTGHYPQRPVMPGVLIVEALAQAAALLTFSEEAVHDENTLYYFVGIENVRFKRPVEPGDQLILSVDFISHKRGFYKFKGEATVDGKLAAEAEFMCMVKKNGE